MMNRGPNQDHKIFSLLLIIYVAIFFVIAQNLRHAYLWFDEAVQFWISKGLNPDSPPLSAPGGFFDVIENNRNYNMDPGGFSILLHFWTVISDNHLWLRLLPFCFFIGIVLAFIYLVYKWTSDRNAALIVGLLPTLYPMTLNMGFEVRAYTMEALGALLCVVALEQYRDRRMKFGFLTWGAVFSIFITSRYSAVIPVFVSVTYIILLLLGEKAVFKEKILRMVKFILPLLFTAFLIYSYTLVFQNPNVAPVTYLPYLSQDPYLIFKPAGLMYALSILLFTALFLMRNRWTVIGKYKHLLIITLSVNYLFIALSLMGKYPWIPPFTNRSNRCISMIVLMLLCYGALIGELLRKVPTEISKFYACIVAIVLIFYIRIENSLFRFFPLLEKISTVETNTDSGKFYRSNVFYSLSEVDIAKYDRIHVDLWQTPYIKYLFEYGVFKSLKGVYPHRFKLPKSGKHDFYPGFQNVFALKNWNSEAESFKDYDLLIGELLPKVEWDDANLWEHPGGKPFLWVKKK